MRRLADLAGAIALGVVGLFALVTGIGYGVGEVTEPGPGLMPALTGGALVILAVLVAATEVITEPAAAPAFEEPSLAPNALWRVIGYIAGIFGFSLLMEPIGTLPTVVLFFVWIVRVVERQSWRVTLALAAGTTLGVWLLFVKALNVTLPMTGG
jgi:putative tricarboxylic transport membrane protein